MIWEVFFMLVVLKIPVVYLCAVVWWAIRAEPRPLEGAARPVLPEPVVPPPESECDWRRRRVAVPRRRPPVRPRPGKVAA